MQNFIKSLVTYQKKKKKKLSTQIQFQRIKKIKNKRYTWSVKYLLLVSILANANAHLYAKFVAPFQCDWSFHCLLFHLWSFVIIGLSFFFLSRITYIFLWIISKRNSWILPPFEFPPVCSSKTVTVFSGIPPPPLQMQMCYVCYIRCWKFGLLCDP